MRKNTQVFVFIIFFICAWSAVAAEKPADYAYGAPVEASGSEALYELTLPPNAYRGVARRDLADVRVFNNAGEVVPYAWRPRRTATTDVPAPLTLTLFPLKATVGTDVDGLSVRVRRSASGAVSVDVKSDGGDAVSEKRVIAYLVDLSSEERTLRAIDFDWNATENFSGKLRMDASDDLANWRTLIAGAPMVSLEIAGQRLQQKRVELPAQKAKYLRLSWVNEGEKRAMPEITAATGELSGKIVEAPREWMKINAAAGEKPGEYVFDLRGQFPVDRLRVDLPDVNTIAQIEILTRDKSDQPWHVVTRGVAYRLRQSGGEIVSPELPVNATAERYWLLRVDQRGGGIGSGMPVLNAGWVPHQLVFAARGTPPFTLAYGNRMAQPASYAIETLIPGYRDDGGAKIAAAKTGTQQTVNVQSAAAQPQKELGGATRLQEQVDWKHWSLWGVLVLGVLILGVMAWRLVKQLGAPHAADTQKRESP